MRKATKTIISFAVVLIAGLNFIVPAFAQDPFTAVAVGGLTGASGAGLFGSMASASGIDIAWSSAGTSSMNSMWNEINPDSVYISGHKHEADRQDPDDLYDYITVDIADWLSVQSDFIVEFATENNVQDNDQGSIASIENFNGIPLDVTFSSGKRSVYLASQYVSGNNTYVFESGDYKIICEPTQFNGKWRPKFYYQGVLNRDTGNMSYANNETYSMVLLNLSGNNVTIGLMRNGAAYADAQSNNIGTKTPQSNTTWESGTVNTNVFDGWESAKVKIPTSVSQLQTGWTPVDFFNELDRIWSGAGEDNIIIENGAEPVPPTPIPDTPLGDVPFDDWIDLWGQGIYQQLENQSDALDLIGSNGIDAIEELESIDTNTEDLVEVAESIDTNIGVGNGILGGIRSLAQSAVNYLEGIAEHVGELVEEIVEGTETLIAGILNQIPQVFSVIFGPIKQASSIWHYVVEWITSIGAPFQFIWSMASGTSYYIILPVYASLAAAVVLAFYKRFGK